MIKYTLRRLIQAIPTFFGITVLSYMLMAAAPGGPVAALTFGPNVPQYQKERLAAQLGVNDPLPIQYLRWLAGDDWMRWDANGDGIADHSFLLPLTDSNGDPLPVGDNKGILRGDFGRSFSYKRPVADMIGERVMATLELGATSLLLGLVVGVPIGILAAVRKSGWFDNATRVLAVVFNAVPVFWLGLHVDTHFWVMATRLAHGKPLLGALHRRMSTNMGADRLLNSADLRTGDRCNCRLLALHARLDARRDGSGLHAHG